MAAVAAIGPACGGGGDDVGDFSNETVREREGLTLRLASDRATYEAGQDVHLRATVENGSENAITYGAEAVPSLTEPLLIEVTTILAGEQAIPLDAEDAPPGGSLAPGDSTEQEATWDQVLATYTTPVDAPPDTYPITVSAWVVLSEDAEPIELTASLDVKLEGNDPVAPVDVVIQSAIAQQEVKDWMEGRATNVICAYGGRPIFYNADVTTGAIAETFDQLYTGAIGNGDPICNPVTEGDLWRVIFSDVTGAAPNKVSALLDLRTADFIRLEEGGPTPAPPTATPTP